LTEQKSLLVSESSVSTATSHRDDCPVNMEVIGIFHSYRLWRKSRRARESNRSRCSGGRADTSLPCCLELGMALQLTGVVLTPLAHIPLWRWACFDIQHCPCSVVPV